MKILIIILSVVIVVLIGIIYYVTTNPKPNGNNNILSNSDSIKIANDKLIQNQKDSLLKENEKLVTQSPVANSNKQPDRVYYNVDGMQLSEYEYKDYIEKKNLKENKEFAKKLKDYYNLLCCEFVSYNWEIDGEGISNMTFYKNSID